MRQRGMTLSQYKESEKMPCSKCMEVFKFGEVVEKIIIRVLPDIEVTVKGKDVDMFEIGATIVSSLKKNGLHPDVEMVPCEEIRKFLENM